MTCPPDGDDFADHNHHIHGITWHHTTPRWRTWLAELIIGLTIGATVALAVVGCATELYGVGS